MERNESIKNINENDIVICINKSYTFVVGEKYRVKEVDDEFVTIHRTEHSSTDYPRIQKLNQLLDAYENCEYEDVKEVLDATLDPIKEMTYFEDVFISVKEERRRKLEKIMEINE